MNKNSPAGQIKQHQDRIKYQLEETQLKKDLEFHRKMRLVNKTERHIAKILHD